jgi:hypothetical protein
MAVFAGPEINESGLVLSVDAGNTKSLLNTVEVLVVAGGGGGGMDMGGGGGGGGVIYSSSVSVTPGSAVSVTVGNGGAGAPAAGTNGQPSGHQYTISATQGGNSVFGSLTAIGGGYGGSSYYGYLPNYGYGGTGGSGGGCSGYTHGGERYVDSNGTPGQGYPGGNSGNPASGSDDHYSGGGGGAGGRGTSGPNHIGPNGVRADGGPGVCYPNMSPYYFAGGGGGSAYTNSTGGYGGIGGGGGGAVGTTYGGAGLNNGSPGGGGGPGQWANTPGGNAGANTGGGGGGGSHYNANNKGGEGGSGIVIVRYPGVQRATGGTVTSSGGYTIHTFTTVGSSTFTPLTLADLSGSGNTGTLTNGPTYSTANGGSVVFDGVDDYVTCGTPSISAGKITVNAWVKINAGSLYQHIVDSASNAWHLAILADNRPYFWNGSTYHTAAPILTVGQWYMITGVQGTTLDIYINGVLGQSIASNINVTTNNVILGAWQSGPRPLNGNISNTQIYNRALSAAEVLQNFNANRFRYGL